MAKKKKLELDDYGMSPELDLPDLDIDSEKPKADRNPTIRVAKDVARGFKETTVNPQFIRTIIRTTMPKGYGDAYDLADKSAASLRSLYNTSAQEIKPAMGELKRLTRRVLPSVEERLPPEVAKRIKAWTEPESSGWRTPSQEEVQENSLQLQLGEIFKFQTKAASRREGEERVRNQLKDGIEQLRHKDQLAQLDAIRLSLGQMSTYQAKVESGYQRKSLEIQLRSYFLAQDQHVQSVRHHEMVKAQLEAITKNTGLPDYVKMQASERVGEVLRNKFLDSVNNGIFGNRTNFVEKLSENLLKTVKGRVSGAVNAARMGMDAAHMTLDMREMGEPESKAFRAGKGLGSLGSMLLNDKLRKHTAKFERLNRAGNRAQQTIGNLPQIMAQWSKGLSAEEQSKLLERREKRRDGKGTVGRLADKAGSGIWDYLSQIGRDTVSESIGKPERQLMTDSIGTLQQVSPFTRQASKSLTEIIPGFLARIHQELRIIRTGDEKTELLAYDYTKNKFATQSVASANSFGALFSGMVKTKDAKGKLVFEGSSADGTRSQIDELINEIDPKKTLTEAQRRDLGQQLIKGNLNNVYGSKANLSNAKTFSGKHASRYAQLFDSHYKDDKNGAKELKMSERYAGLGSWMTDSRADIQHQYNAGLAGSLEEAGLIKENGEIDLERLTAYYYGDTYQPSGSAAGGGSGGRFPPPPSAAGAQEAPRPPRAPRHRQPRQNQPQGTGGGMNVSELLEAVREGNVKAIAQQQLEMLARIDARLEQGLITYEGQAGTPDAPGGRGWNMSIKDAAKRITKSGAWVGKKVNQVVNSAIKSGVGAAKLGLNLATFGLSGAVGKMRGVRDVYVPGESIPRLTAWKIKAGHYKDQASGRVIKTFKDIAGSVVDETGGVVLDANEVKTAYIKQGMGKRLLTAAGALAGLGNSLVKFGLGAIPDAFRVAKSLVTGAFGLLQTPQDVYVRGSRSPVLLARVMRGGGYFSQRTKKVIRHPGDIDGAVVNDRGEVVLTEEDLKGGVLNREGKEIKTGWQKIAGFAGKVLGAGLGLASSVANFAGKTIAGVTKGAFSIFGKLAMPDGILISGSRKVTERLTEILELLKERLPGKRRVVGDRDGDGVREGSYEDLLRKRKDKATGATSSAGAPNSGAGIGAGISALLAKLKGKKSEERDEDGNLLDDAADVADIADAARGRGGRRGRGKAGWASKAKGLLKGGMKVAGGLGLAYGAYSTYDNLKQGNYGDAALDAGLTAVGGASMLGGLGGMAGIGAGALGVIGAALASPVVLGALAVGAVGGLGYLGYKAMTAARLGTLSTLRYAQYGFEAKDDTHLQAVFGLESQLEPLVRWNNGQPTIDESKARKLPLLDAFGIDKKKTSEINRWLSWFVARFKPVFYTHLAALKAVDGGKLSGVDGLKGEQAKRYLDLAKFPEGPYDFNDTPFSDGKWLRVGRSGVEEAAAAADKALLKAQADPQKATAEVAGKATAAAGVAALTAQAKTGTPQASGGVAPTQARALAALDGPSGASYSATSSFEGWGGSASGKLDALSALRYKTYGLVELTLEKVRALQQLESVVGKRVALDPKEAAEWSGSLEQVLNQMGGSFGVEGQRNAGANAWKDWFTNRFLPVFLNYASALGRFTRKSTLESAAGALKAQDAPDVAAAVYTTPGVWSRTRSPWPGYELNAQASSVEENFQALKEGAKKVVLEEVKGNKPEGKTGQDNGVQVTSGGQAQSLGSRAWDAVKSVGNKITAAGSWVADTAGKGLAAVGRGASQVMDKASMLGQAAMNGVASAGRAVADYAGKAVDAAGNAALALKEGMAAGMGVKELANFMGQQAHESGDFKILGEGLTYKSADRIRAVFGKNANLQRMSPEQIQGLVNNPEALANVVYGNRMGNTEPGDGYKYRGRGFIQLTGKSNYAQCGKDLGIDLVNNPDMASDPAVAAKIGLWYWKRRVAGQGVGESVEGATKAIQGGQAHLAERKSKVAQWEAKLQASIKPGEGAGAGAAAGVVGQPGASAAGVAAVPPGGGGGRGSVNPTPGAEATASAPAAAPVAAKAATPSAAVAAASAGFQPMAASQQNQDLKAQAQYQKEAAGEAMSSIDATLKSTQTIQQAQLEVMRQMLQVLQGGAMSPAGAKPAENVTPLPARQPRGMPTAPISMAKTA